MPFVKGQSGNPAGRPKGAESKLGRAVKDAIAQAAEDLGGAARMVEWAKEDPKNEAAFWTSIYPKLLPFTVSGDPDNPLHLMQWPLPKSPLDQP